MTGILLCWPTRFMFEREQRAILQWPFMPCEKYTSLLVRLMKALSCPPHYPPTSTSGRVGLFGARASPVLAPSATCGSEVSLLFVRIRKEQPSVLVQVCAPVLTLARRVHVVVLCPAPIPFSHPVKKVIKAPQNEGLSREQRR